MSSLSSVSRRFSKLVALVAVAFAFVVVAPAQFASADILDQACTGAGSNSSTCKSRTTTNPVSGPNGVLINVANILAIIAGIMAVIVMILGGIKYITSGGDSGKTASAKNTIVFGIVGLLVIIFARTIVGIVVSRIK